MDNKLDAYIDIHNEGGVTFFSVLCNGKELRVRSHGNKGISVVIFNGASFKSFTVLCGYGAVKNVFKSWK